MPKSVDTPLPHRRAMKDLRRRERYELESYDEYARVVVNLGDKLRVIECKDSIQWIIQRITAQSLGSRQWRGISFCRTKEALLRYARTGPGENAILDALPDRFPDPVTRSAPRGAATRMWPLFVQVAGPPLTPLQYRFATVSDRDPKTGRSSYEETEAGNRARLDGSRNDLPESTRRALSRSVQTTIAEAASGTPSDPAHDPDIPEFLRRTPPAGHS
jgi:hypothetical protein